MIAVHPDLSTMPPASGKVTRALISVFDKTGVIELGKALSAAGLKFSLPAEPPRNFKRQEST